MTQHEEDVIESVEETVVQAQAAEIDAEETEEDEAESSDESEDSDKSNDGDDN